MNILFVNYGDFTTNSLNHIGGFANMLCRQGLSCAVAVSARKETIENVADPLFIPLTYDEALKREKLFPDGRGPDVIHAWTPRECVREFVVALQAKTENPAHLIVHLEDNEAFLLEAYTGKSVAELAKFELSADATALTSALSHPLRLGNLLRLADAATVIEERLREHVPPGTPASLLRPGVDPAFVGANPPGPEERRELGLRDDDKLIVFTGGASFANEPEIRELYLAIALLNQRGVPTRLIRTGFNSPQFHDSLPPSLREHVVDLGFINKSRLPGLLAMADALVQPGRPGAFNDYRLPSKLPEFLASGRPVITPRTNIGLELRDGEDALLLRTGSPEEITAACERVFGDVALAASLGQNGRAFAARHFDLAKNTAGLLALFENVLKNPARAPWTTLGRSGVSDVAMLADQLRHAESRDTVLERELIEQTALLEQNLAALRTHGSDLEKELAEADKTRAHAANLEKLLDTSRHNIEFAQQHSANLEAVIARLREHIEDLRKSLDKSTRAEERAALLLEEQTRAITQRDDKIRRMQDSFSWRATAPLRALRRRFFDRKVPAGAAAAPDGAMQTEPGPVSGDFHYVIDTPKIWADLDARQITVSGWVLDPGECAVAAVRARTGGKVFDAEHGIRRVDVEAAMPDNADARHPGFAVTAQLTAPSGTLDLEARDAAGAWRCFFRGEYSLAPDASDREPDAYDRWRKNSEDLSSAVTERLRDDAAGWDDPPRLSIVMPVFNTPERWLRRAIESVRAQTYPHWELCIADDASTDPHVRPLLEHLAADDERIRVVFRPKNGHISAASNSALEIATGEWIALLDHDDELAPHALHEVVALLRAEPETDLVYSDEDKIDENGGRSGPNFKPEFLPDLFTAQNYLSHLSVYRASIVREIEGFRLGYEGSQDWDLALRFVERTEPARIRHIPKVLYHWRAIAGSTALLNSEKTYPAEAARRALSDHFERRGESVVLHPVPGGHWRVQFPIPDPAPLVSLIIPTHNRIDLVRRCVESIQEKTTYPNYEIVIIDNRSDDPETLAWLEKISAPLDQNSKLKNPTEPARATSDNSKISVIRDAAPFNFSALNNRAVTGAAGEFVGLLNNDLEVITPGWLEEMVSQAARPGMGCVGAMLYFPDDTIQHAGVILGVGGVAGHAFKKLLRGTEGFFNRARLVQNYSAVTAACLVVRKSTFEEVGGLGEKKLAVAFNDIDLCLKARAAGYRNLWTPFAELYHHESATRGYEDTAEKHTRFRSEIEVMQERWGHLLQNDPAYSPNLSLESEQFAIARVTRAK